MTNSTSGFDPHDPAGPVPSPCTGVCTMDTQAGLCRGCQRTIEEIIDWSSATEERKRAVWVRIQQRRAER